MNDWERLHRQAEEYKESYPPGTRVMLLHMNDPYHPVDDGMRGTVDQKGAQLYDTLSSYMGMTDEEIRQSGFLSLVPYFDKDCYAQTIAEYLIHVGTENTTTGNWHIPFSLVTKNYGVNLATDAEMLDKVCECLYSNGDIVSEFQVGEDEIDMMFYTNYCPYAREDEEVEMTQQM